MTSDFYKITEQSFMQLLAKSDSIPTKSLEDNGVDIGSRFAITYCAKVRGDYQTVVWIPDENVKIHMNPLNRYPAIGEDAYLFKLI